MPEFLYRCDYRVSSGGSVRVYIDRFQVLRETPKGYWIDCFLEKRWVSKAGKRRFAHPSEEEAAQAFQARKKAQLRILNRHREIVLRAQIIPLEHYVPTYNTARKLGRRGGLLLMP